MKLLKTIPKILNYVILAWLVFYSAMLFMLSFKELAPIREEIFFEFYSIHDYYVAASVEGSGEFAYVDIYNQEDAERAEDLYLEGTGSAYIELAELNLNQDDDLVGEGRYFIANLDSDEAVEIARFSTLDFKVGSPIYQIDPNEGLSIETNEKTIQKIKRVAFFFNLFVFGISFLLLVLEFFIVLPVILFVKMRRKGKIEGERTLR